MFTRNPGWLASPTPERESGIGVHKKRPDRAQLNCLL
jgi:hypothetical protein